MSTVPAEPANPAPVNPADVKKTSKSIGKIIVFVLLVPLLAFIVVEANTLRLEQHTEQLRRQVGAAGGRSETERRVPDWLQPLIGPNAHSFLDRTAIVGVTMNGPEIGDEQVAKVVDLPDISWINLAESNVTSAGLASVARLKTLQTIDLTNTQVSDLTELTKLPELAELRLNYCAKVNLEHLSALSKIPTLRALGANSLRLQDEGIAVIADCTGLEQLYIMGTRVSDNGLVPLQKLKNLKQLKLTYSTYNRDDLAAFRAAVPECKVIE
jgi:Leucine-rich repeat (LRR) protein